jgi:hypothetical protein
MTSTSREESEPRVLVAFADQWASVLLCAELRERGYCAACVASLSAELLLPEPGLGPVRVTLADRERCRKNDVTTLQYFRAFGEGPACLLLIAADAEIIAGPWDEVLRRPLTIGALADAVERLAGTTAPSACEPPLFRWIFLRPGDPWPAAQCTHCGRSRHCQPSPGADERETVRVELVKFALEHAHPSED